MSSFEKPEQANGRAAKINKLITTLAVGLLIVSNLFVFGPATIYQANTEEMAIPLISFLKTLALPGLISLFVLCLVGLLLRGKSHQIYISVLFAFGVLVWLQGNFLVWNYGLLNGRGIDWAKDVWRGLVDGTLWAGLLVLSVLFYRKVHRIAAWGSAAVIAILSVSLLITSLQNPETWAAKEKSRRPLVPPEEIFEFSTRSNVIHLVLDGFQSDIFSELVAGNFDYYSRSLPGFTFFKEALGSFPTTYMSVPAFISGRVYKNDLPMRRFVSEVNRGETIFNELYDLGYETHLVEASRFTKGSRHSQEYQIAVPYGGTQRKNMRSNSAQMLDMSLFRHAPHFLKRYVYNHQTWLIQRIFTPRDRLLNLEYFSHAAFMDDLINHLSVKRDKPVYKYIHLMTSHFPMVVNEDCQYAGEIPSSRDNIKIQANCVLHQIVRFLDNLRRAGIYDSSLIIIQSDHGQGHDIAWANPHGAGEQITPIGGIGLPVIAGSALALVLIKPPQDGDAFRVSPAQVSLTDIPTTVNSILGLAGNFGGRPMFGVNPDEVRERRFLYHEWGTDDWKRSYFPRLDEFIVKGSAFDIDSWRLERTYFPPRRRR
jgi:Sulfatase